LHFFVFGLSGGGSLGLELAEVLVSAVVDAVEAGFVAGGEVERAQLVGKALEGECQLDGAVAVRELPLDLGPAAGGFGVEQGGLDDHEAAHAPTGGDHLVDHIGLDGRHGMVGGMKIGEEFLEFFGIFPVEDDRAAGREAVGEAIAGGYFLAGGGFGATGFGAVGAGGVGS
jgi:hypothetical protein